MIQSKSSRSYLYFLKVFRLAGNCLGRQKFALKEKIISPKKRDNFLVTMNDFSQVQQLLNSYNANSKWQLPSIIDENATSKQNLTRQTAQSIQKKEYTKGDQTSQRSNYKKIVEPSKIAIKKLTFEEGSTYQMHLRQQSGIQSREDHSRTQITLGQLNSFNLRGGIFTNELKKSSNQQKVQILKMGYVANESTCRCKKNQCQRRHCECYSSRKRCSKHCECVSCFNFLEETFPQKQDLALEEKNSLRRIKRTRKD